MNNHETVYSRVVIGQFPLRKMLLPPISFLVYAIIHCKNNVCKYQSYFGNQSKKIVLFPLKKKVFNLLISIRAFQHSIKSTDEFEMNIKIICVFDRNINELK